MKCSAALTRILASLFSPVEIATYKLTHMELCAQTLDTPYVTSPSLCIKFDATELLKQSQSLLLTRPSFRKLTSADTELNLLWRLVWLRGHWDYRGHGGIWARGSGSGTYY